MKGKKRKEMDLLDYKEVQRHINIANVAYHLSLEIVETRGYEIKAICPFVGYNKNSKIPTIDYKKIMMNFIKWQQNGEYTPHNEVFDIGRTTNLSLR